MSSTLYRDGRYHRDNVAVSYGRCMARWIQQVQDRIDSGISNLDGQVVQLDYFVDVDSDLMPTNDVVSLILSKCFNINAAFERWITMETNRPTVYRCCVRFSNSNSLKY